MELIRENVHAEGRVKLVFHNPETGQVRISRYKNKLTQGWAAALIRRLCNKGTKANEGIATWCILGNGAGTVSETDTAMFSELVRKLCTQREASGGVATISTFFNSSEGTGAITEVGIAGEDADATPGSGTLMEHCGVSETKTPPETLTVEIEITLTIN